SLHFDAHCAPCPATCQSAELLAFDVQRADHLGIVIGLAAQVGRKLGAAARIRIKRLSRQLGLDLRRLDRATEEAHELGDDRRWVFAGATKPNHTSASKPGKPDSAMVGSSGKGSIRRTEGTAIARSDPASSCPLTSW